LHRRIRFDIAHHVTFVNYWLPSFLPVLPVPFVLGPVGGGESAPRNFRRSFSLRGQLYDVFRHAAKSLAHLDPVVRYAARRSAVALATTPETAGNLQRLGCRNVGVLSQVALSAEELRSIPSPFYRHNGPFRVLSAGRLLHWKGFELGIRAFAEFRKSFPESEYRIIGDGPELSRLEALACRLGVDGAVRFTGSMAREQVMHAMAQSDVLLNPSLHDSGSYVCAEAMAVGLPVICLDTGGPALLVTADTGIKVEALTPTQVVDDLTGAMTRLAADPGFREQIGTSARTRARDVLAWNAKGDVINSIYERVATQESRILQAPAVSANTEAADTESPAVRKCVS
jgi:glycosyltransferase involved in cell wall biosynthesis